MSQNNKPDLDAVNAQTRDVAQRYQTAAEMHEDLLLLGASQFFDGAKP